MAKSEDLEVEKPVDEEADFAYYEDWQEDIEYDEVRDFDLAEPRPGILQQTLWRSFLLGGIGLHSGEMSYVRVRPAFAGEGRYFVRMRPGTLRDIAPPCYVEEEMDIFAEKDPQQTIEESIMSGMNEEGEEMDEEEEVTQTELFSKYLDYKETDGYLGDFRDFVEHYFEIRGKELHGEEHLLRREDPVPQTKFDVIIQASLSSLAKEDPLYETTLENDRGDRVESVEHLLAALEACGVDNARIEIEGPEVPIVDGSSLGWTIEIERAGVTVAERQEKKSEFYVRAALKPDELVKVQEGDAFIMLLPSDKMQITYGIDHTEECLIIGRQWFSWCLQDDQHFKLHLAAAKTYVAHVNHLHEMHSEGYMKAGSESVVIIGDGTEWYDEDLLSYSFDEPVRHKILDLIGDLSLLQEDGMSGLPFGHIIAYKANHAMHHAFAKKIMERYRQQYIQFAPFDEKVEREPYDESEYDDDAFGNLEDFEEDEDFDEDFDDEEEQEEDDEEEQEEDDEEEQGKEQEAEFYDLKSDNEEGEL